MKPRIEFKDWAFDYSDFDLDVEENMKIIEEYSQIPRSEIYSSEDSTEFIMCIKRISYVLLKTESQDQMERCIKLIPNVLNKVRRDDVAYPDVLVDYILPFSDYYPDDLNLLIEECLYLQVQAMKSYNYGSWESYIDNIEKKGGPLADRIRRRIY